MRRAKYSAKQVYLPNASRIGFDTQTAKPGHWITWENAGQRWNGRVLGRIDETERDGLENCTGWLAVIRLTVDMSHSTVDWIDPQWVTRCQEAPPRALLAWITGDEWVKRGADIGRYVAMADHGTTSEMYIATRDDPAKPYNARPEYVAQFVLS